jgi:hypothetical protein
LPRPYANDRGALYVASDAVTFDKRATVIAFAAENRFPTVYFFVDEAEEGGLLLTA